ncbi:DWNN-domain-containing protein [Massarina eburnea CBS 473.64]|uniref:DWNN-domain-containing protein n=1 Tax=Massarina eburnea CBS 473.64 TaxID=1395130 RepID=A0A6A6RYR5_9PLEO|nr:DWNN-domain-containing protein [Massarina eburnea CBS 473.64]
MSSSVFYKFKNSKEPERIVFDGTDISVFELKREIIIASGLGDGSDFDLRLFSQDQPEVEYDDDTTSISRSSTVIAARRPAKPGQGRAARYISGRAPVRAKKAAKPVASASIELDPEAALAQDWKEKQEVQMKNAPRPNAQSSHRKGKVPVHDPPPGYVCRLCKVKGHWIQECPTNNDPNFKPPPETKRTTGIPRSFLKTVEKPADDEDARGIMLNADGEYVQVMTDTKAWEKFQEKTNAAKAQAANVDAANKEARERGLECSLDKRMFVDPVKTPCCSKTYCHDCIENALADGDLVCPSCKTEGVLIDDLAEDEEMVQKIKDFEAEKAKEKSDKEKQATEEEAQATAKFNSVPPVDVKAKAGDTTSSANPASRPSPGPGGNGSDTDTSTTSKKRKEAPTDIKPPTAPKAMRQQKEQQSRQPDQGSVAQDFIQQMEALKQMQEQKVPNGPMGMSMGPGMPSNPMMGMVPPQGMNGMNGMMGGMNGMNGGYPPHMNQWNGGYNQGGYPQPNGMGYGYNMHPDMLNNPMMGMVPPQGMNGMNGMMGGMNQWNGGYNQGGGYPQQYQGGKRHRG